MYKTLTTLLLLSMMFAGSVFAGPGHDHGHSHGPISSEAAANSAIKRVGALVDAGKIDASWSAIKPASVEQKTYAKGPEWVVTFKNDKISDKSRQTLYLFFSLDGHYLASNYTGQ